MDRRQAIARLLELPAVAAAVAQTRRADPGAELLVLTAHEGAEFDEAAAEGIKRAFASAGFDPRRIVMLWGVDAHIIKTE